MGMFISFRYSRSMRINVFGVSNIKGFIVTRILSDLFSNSDQILIDYPSPALLVTTE